MTHLFLESLLELFGLPKDDNLAWFGDHANAAMGIPLENEQLHHSVLEDLRDTGLENIAKESGFLTEQGSIPGLRSVIPNAPRRVKVVPLNAPPRPPSLRRVTLNGGGSEQSSSSPATPIQKEEEEEVSSAKSGSRSSRRRRGQPAEVVVNQHVTRSRRSLSSSINAVAAEAAAANTNTNVNNNNNNKQSNTNVDEKNNVAVGANEDGNNNNSNNNNNQQSLLAASMASSPIDESSASLSPMKRGRSKTRSAGSGRRGKARRSRSGGGGGNSANAGGPKGLRHFALAVCNKVREKGVTSYNEVADELVHDFEEDDGGGSVMRSDEKNIRRRVYDALNVLSAMDIIRKDKKDIHWVGLPACSSAEVRDLEQEVRSRAERVAKKEEHARELQQQLHLYRSLIERNAKAGVPASTSMSMSSMLHEGMTSNPNNNTISSMQAAERLGIPFILVSTNNTSKIDLRVSSDRTEYCFDFTHPFELRDDTEIVKAVLLNSVMEMEGKNP